jgi:hypothetical protein
MPTTLRELFDKFIDSSGNFYEVDTVSFKGTIAVGPGVVVPCLTVASLTPGGAPPLLKIGMKIPYLGNTFTIDEVYTDNKYRILISGGPTAPVTTPVDMVTIGHLKEVDGDYVIDKAETVPPQPVNDTWKWTASIGTGDVKMEAFPIIKELQHIYDTNMTVDIFVDRIGKLIGANSPTTSANTYSVVISKFTTLLRVFSKYIDYEGKFGNDYAVLETKVTAVENAYKAYTDPTKPYPRNSTELMNASRSVKEYIHEVIYPKCKLVHTDNLDGGLKTNAGLLQTRMVKCVTEDVLTTAPDNYVLDEFNVETV